jgi:SnoaL-like domain
MTTEDVLPTTSTAIEDRRTSVGGEASSALIRLALDYNDALDRCTQTGGENIEELMELFAEGAMWTAAGFTSLVGKAAIREMFLTRAARYQQDVQLRGIELCGDLVICHGERRDTTFVQEGRQPGMRVLLVKRGKIEQVTVVGDPEAYPRMRGRTAAEELQAILGENYSTAPASTE